MGFFFNDAKADDKPAKKAKRKGVIPIQSLQALGCSACPRDKDDSLRSPKMRPEGTSSPLIYLLGTSPSEEDDRDDMHWLDVAGETIYDKFGRSFMKEEVRSNYITQCLGDEDAAATECCRPRIVTDIEETKPRIIVGIGDAPLRWATALRSGSAMQHRGTLFAIKVGSHECWFYSILYPNFAHKKSFKKSEYEIALEHDIEWVKDWAKSPDFVPARFYAGPYDEGVEIITGHEPGDMQRLEKALVELARLRHSAIDVETNGLRVYMLRNPMLLTVAVGCFERVVAFPVHHPEGWGTQAQIKRVEALLLRFLLESGEKAAHNLSMEMEWLSYFFGSEVLRRSGWADTMALAYVLDERKGTKSLEVQTVIHFGFNLKAQTEIDTARLLEYPLKKVLRYNGMDAKWTDLLRRIQAPKVARNPQFQAEYERLVRTAPTLVMMENLGMPVDFKYAEVMEKKLDGELDAIDAKIRRCPEVKDYGRRFGTFNPGNTDDVLQLMRDVLKRREIEVIDKRTGKRTGYTTDEDHLVLIPPEDVPSAPLILEHRGLEKLQGTYIRNITTHKIVCVDGKVRSKYSAMVAETGRLNSEDPNIQNWPKRTPIQKAVRGIIAATRGEWMVACDYGQIEFRVVGMAAEDEEIIRACWTGYDVHKFWAERMVKLYPKIKDRVVAEHKIDWDEKGLKFLRQDAKNMWVFPQFFGAHLNSCAANLKLPMNIAEDLAEEFWDTFRATKEWQERLLERYEKKGYVETLDGRRRRGALSSNQIINHPIQGTALSIVCASMNALSERAEIDERWDRHPRFNGHDDLSFFMPDSTLEENIPIIAEEMCKVRFPWINVPLIVEASIGPRWNELDEYKVFRSNELFNTPNPYEESPAPSKPRTHTKPSSADANRDRIEQVVLQVLHRIGEGTNKEIAMETGGEFDHYDLARVTGVYLCDERKLIDYRRDRKGNAIKRDRSFVWFLTPEGQL